ncbi:MAG: metal-dependent hydrolase [Halobacteria archaeon]
MDAITHILTGYSIGNLLAMNSFELTSCIIASAAMDLDIFISRVSFKYHRDFSHSLLSAFILSISLAAFSLLFNQAFLKILSLALLSSLSHVLLDLSTTWGIPLLYPVKKQSSLELDIAVNPVLLLTSLLLLVVMAISNSTSLPILAILLLIFYLLMRAILKQIAARKLDGGEIALLPTYSPFIWKVLQRWSSEHGYTQKTGLLYILQSRYEEINTRAFPYLPVEIGRIAIEPPLENERAAILYSSSMELVKSFTSKFKYKNARAKLENGMWRVIWTSSEIGLQIELLISREGELVKLSSNWQR